MAGDWRSALRSRLLDSRAIDDAPLRNATTLRIGGPADCLVELESERDLLALFSFLGKRSIPWFVLGKGSNLLIPDAGLRGVVIRLGKAFRRVLVEPETGTAVAGAGLANATFVERCRTHGLGGMEYLVAIPGTIGGAIAMNAGAHDGETAAFLVSVRYYEVGGAVVERPADEFDFAYRRSPFRGQDGRLLLGGTFRLRPMGDDEIQSRKAEFQRYRRETQPREYPNCGSVFKNPPGHHAARLIQESGLKGRCVGDAQVSAKHANFIVNRGAATAADVIGLIDLVRCTVYSRTGIRLELEVQVL